MFGVFLLPNLALAVGAVSWYKSGSFFAGVVRGLWVFAPIAAILVSFGWAASKFETTKKGRLRRE
jgi:hypothetical protein